MNPNLKLKPVLEERKFEAANVTSILNLISPVPLNAAMTPAQHSAALKDKLDAQLTRVNKVVENLLSLVNSSLGMSYTLADIDSGALSADALLDAVNASIGYQKLVVFSRISLPSIVSAPTGTIDVTSAMSFADQTDWSLPQFGGFGAPYNNTSPIPFSIGFMQETRVDLLNTLDGTPVLDESDNTVSGFVSGYDSTLNSMTVVWGYMDKADNQFYVADFPATLSGSYDIVFPVKTNLADAPADFLGMARGGIGVPGVSGSIAGLEAIVGASELTAPAFVSAMIDPVLSPSGYSSIVAALLDVLAKAKESKDLIDELSLFAGKAVGDTAPNFSLVGDNRDYVVAGDSIIAAISKLNAASVQGNIVTVGDIGANFASINDVFAAIDAGNIAIPTANKVLVVKVAPGEYLEDIVLRDFVYIIGSGIESTLLKGVVELPNRLGTSEGIVGSLFNMTISSDSATTMLISANGDHSLHSLVIENTSGGTALEVAPETDSNISIFADVVLKNASGLGLRIIDGNVKLYGSMIVANNGISLQSAAELHMSGGDILSSGDGISVDGSSVVTILGGNIVADNRGLFTVGGAIKLLGGSIKGANYSVVANALAPVTLGATALLGASVFWGGAVISPAILAQGLSVEDVAGNFVGNNAEAIFAEIGGTLVVHQNEINISHSKSNLNEHDALVDVAILQISLMPENYTMFMVDSFMYPTTNTYPDGDDKALIVADHSALMHQGDAGSYNHYQQNFDGVVVDKDKVYLKTSLQKGLADDSGNHDWVIEFRLEVSGGRYNLAPLSYLLHSIQAVDFVPRFEQEFDLNAILADSGAPLAPIVASGEVVSVKITIKSDSAMSQATPTIRSFVAFI